jgi:carbon-monoxide dehydrogenase small subunit
MTTSIHASVNGEPCQFQCETTDTLLKVLRENLRMTGTKQGCGTGDCGACSVIMNGELVCACLVLAVECGQADIRTVEGLSGAGQLHPLQQAFLDNAALQCGICTPGLLMAAKALLDKHPQPDETQVRYWIAGNLCRCTGYDKIVRAIMEAAPAVSRAAALPAVTGAVL